MSYPVKKAYQNQVSGVIALGTTGNVTLNMSDSSVSIKYIDVSATSTITDITVDGISVGNTVPVDLAQVFGDIVNVNNVVVSIDNSAGTVDDNVTVTVKGIQLT